MDWVIVQVVIGLSFLFFLLSIVASAVLEGVSGVLKLRSRMLEKGILNLVSGSTKPGDDGLQIVRELYSNSLVNSYGKDNSKPSYLSSRSFRNALFDVTELLEATSDPSTDPLKADQIRAQVESRIDAIPSEHLRHSLLTIWRGGLDRDATEFRAGVERWFDRGMERLSGWYKRRSQMILFLVGLVLAMVMNASAVSAADRLWKDDGTRRALLAQAETQEADSTGSDALGRLETLRFPIGWEESNRPHGTDGWAVALLGWVLTGFAVTFGAPFWFDLLSRISNLRSTGGKPDTTLVPAPTKSEVSTVRLSVATEAPGAAADGGTR